MNLVNMENGKAYPMKKVGPYTLFNGELAIDRSEQSAEWISKSKVFEAILLGSPKVEVLEATEEGRALLADCYLEIMMDREPTSSVLSLMGENQKITMAEAQRFWFGGVEGAEAKGIFLPNGTLVQAIVRRPRKIESILRIRITIEAELYEASPIPPNPEPTPRYVDPSVKTAKEIGEIIQRAEHQDWSMVATADLVGHSVACTTDLCLMFNTARPLTCSCGRGIRS